MSEGARIPSARKPTEAELVAEIADQVDFHGYKVIKHTVTVDHEKDETRLNLTLLKGNPEQKVLNLKEGGKPDEGDGAE